MCSATSRSPTATADIRADPVNIRHVILDRDGVLNRESAEHSYILTRADFQWLPGALEGLALLHGAGIRLSIATNQSAVGRGLMDHAQLEDIMAHMRAQAAAAGGPIDAVFYCPHAPEDACDCRKPQPGLLIAAVSASGIEPGRTLFAGDDLRDVEAAQAAGVAPVLLRTGKGARAEAQVRNRGFTLPIYDNLLHFARELTHS
jgi:D-glycero-D-manno-heptose 1,7-bisphosphate phosphatase